jgi:polyisoprenoid-binding protein YceI
MRIWMGLFIAAVASLAPVSACSEELVLTLAPEKTRATFRVRATFFDIDGVLALGLGQIRFDSATGAASGQVTIDLRESTTGNRLRDWEMHKRVLETERYPLAVFRVDHMLGTLGPSGTSNLVLAGIVTMHGAEHAMVVPVRAIVSGDTLSAETLFEIPYVAWGLRDPSLFFLRVAQVAVVSMKARGDLRPDPEVAKDQVTRRRADPMTSLRGPKQ